MKKIKLYCGFEKFFISLLFCLLLSLSAHKIEASSFERDLERILLEISKASFCVNGFDFLIEVFQRRYNEHLRQTKDISLVFKNDREKQICIDTFDTILAYQRVSYKISKDFRTNTGLGQICQPTIAKLIDGVGFKILKDFIELEKDISVKCFSAWADYRNELDNWQIDEWMSHSVMRGRKGQRQKIKDKLNKFDRLERIFFLIEDYKKNNPLR